MTPGDYLAVGATETQKDIPQNGGYAYLSDGRLILNNYSYEGVGHLYEVKDDYSTRRYPTAIYSEYSLQVIVHGHNSLISANNYNRSHAIFSLGGIEIIGDGSLYLKAKYPLFAEEDILIQNVYLDIYSEYFYGMFLTNGTLKAIDSTLKIRGERGIQTSCDNENIEFYGSHIDINVAEYGIFSCGEIIVSDSYLKAVSNDPEFFDEYCSIYSTTGEIDYYYVVSRASTDPYGNSCVMFKTEDHKNYHFVELYRQNTLKYIDIVDILQPETGCFPDFEGSVESPYTEILNIQWFELKNDEVVDIMGGFDSFLYGEKYRLRVTVKAGDAYEFDDVNTSSYIGNDLVSNYCSGLNLKIRVLEKDYIATDNNDSHTVNIGKIALKDGDYLQKGASAVTTAEPDDNYAYYKDGILYFVNFADRNADVVFNEGILEINITGENIVASISDSFEKDENAHDVIIYGEGSLDVIGSNDALERANGINLNGDLAIVSGTIYVDADIYCCMDVQFFVMRGGEIYCNTSQAGVFAGQTAIYIMGGEFHAFDGGGWWQFINDEVIIGSGTVYVSNDGRNNFETATEWDGETPLKTYDSVWIKGDSSDPEPDPEPEPDYLLGDVNNDGVVNSTDYLRIKSHFLGGITLEGKALKAGDVTKDGVINSTDYLRIKGHFLGTYNLYQ